MKLVGGDSGRYEHETFVEEVLLAPSERAIVDVLFDTPGAFPLEHRTPDHTYVLGDDRRRRRTPSTPSFVDEFEQLRTSARAHRRTRAPRRRHRARARQDAGLQVADAAALRRHDHDRDCMDVPDAPRDRARRTGHVPDSAA